MYLLCVLSPLGTLFLRYTVYCSYYTLCSFKQNQYIQYRHLIKLLMETSCSLVAKYTTMFTS